MHLPARETGQRTQCPKDGLYSVQEDFFKPALPMNPLLSDTSPAAERWLIEGYRRMSPRRKLERVTALNRALEQLQRARLRAEYGPGLSERELRLRLAALRLPRAVMRKVFGWDPEEEGY